MKARISRACALLWLGAALACRSGATLSAAAPRRGVSAASVATLGVSLRGPSDEEGRRFKLPFEARWQGLVVESVDAGGPAALAGIREGEVLLQVGEVTLYSRDDLRDFLGVRTPGESVDVRLRRTEDGREEVVRAILGASGEGAGSAPRLRWQFASLGQLPFALKEAEKTRKSVLIGLSGAET